MFTVLRFTWYYRRLKRTRRVEGEWTFDIRDVVTLLNRLPLRVLGQFTHAHVHYLGRYRGTFCHPTPHDLLVAVTQLTYAMRRHSEFHADHTAATTYPLNVWLQPNANAFTFRHYTTALVTACNELYDVYTHLPDDKLGYYRRRSQSTLTDVFSYAEIMAELVLARRTLDVKTP